MKPMVCHHDSVCQGTEKKKKKQLPLLSSEHSAPSDCSEGYEVSELGMLFLLVVLRQ